MANEIKAEEAVNLIKETAVKIVDVREIDEYEFGHISGSINFPMSRFSSRILDIASRENKVIVICRGGVRSFECTKKLEELGYKDVCSVAGGLRELNKFLEEKVEVKE